VAATNLVISNNVDGGNLSLSGTAGIAGKDVGAQSISAYASTANVARLNTSVGSSIGAGGATSFAVSIPAPTSGNALVAVISTRGNAGNQVSSITQSGAVWTRASQGTNTANGGTTVEIWCAPNVTNAGTTVTVNLASSLHAAAVVMEYSGLVAANLADVSAGASGNSINANTGSTPATSQPNEVWVGGIGLDSSSDTLSAILNSFISVTNVASSDNANKNAVVYALERIAAANAPALSGGTVSSSDLWSGTIATFKAALSSGTPLVLSGPAAGNYTLTGLSGSVAITPATLSLTAGNQGKTYGATLALGTTNFLASGLMGGDTVTGVTLASSGSDATALAGTYSIVPSAAAGTGLSNYNLAYNNGILTVGAAALSITAGNQSKTYGAALVLGTTNFTASGLMNSDTVTGVALNSIGADASAAVGSYDIVPSAATGSGLANYSIAYNNGALTVNQQTPVVAAAPTASAITYGQTLAASTLSGGVVTNASGGTVAGSFAYTMPTIAPNAGSANVGVTFTPTDTANYNTATASTTVMVNKAALTITASNDTKIYGQAKIYGAGLTNFTSSGLKNGETVGSVTITAGGGTGTNDAVGSYPLTPSAAVGGTFNPANYTIGYNNGSLTINALPVNLVGSRTYDATTNAAGAILSIANVVGSDDVTVASGVGGLASKSAGSRALTSIGTLVLSGARATNYAIIGATGSVTISPASLTVTATGVNKTYNGTTNATVTLLDNRISGDIVTDNYTAASFGDKNVGMNKTVSVSGISISGTDAGNYAVSNTTASTTANITVATLSVTATGLNRTYNGTTNATVTLSDNKFSGDSITDSYTVASFANKNVGTNKTVTVAGIAISGADAGNYTLSNTTASATANITGATLTVSATGVNRVYDRTTNATVTLSDNRIAGDVVTDNYAAASFANKNVGTNKPVTVTGLSISGTDAANYTLGGTTATTTANITPASLTVSATGVNKPYDGTTNATVTLSDNKISGDTVTDSYVAARFADSNVGTGKFVNVVGISISGVDAANYALSNTTASATASITPATVTIGSGLTANSKFYDGTTAATLSSNNVVLSGVVAADAGNVSLSTNGWTATFASASVGNGKTVTVGGLTLTGSATANYALTQPALTANITAVAVIVASGLTANNKVYNGTTAAAISSNNVVLSGVIGADLNNVNLSTNGYTAAFASASVGAGKTVTVGALTLTGSAAANYALTQPGLTASITAAPVTVSSGITANNKVYDGTTAAFISSNNVVLSGVISADTNSVKLSTNGYSATFASASVGTGKAVTVGGLTLMGSGSSNYALTQPTLTANITGVTVTIVSGITANNKVYDGTTSETISSNNVVLSGVMGADSGNVYLTTNNYTATFASAGVGTNKAVTVGGLALVGSAATNYTLAQPGLTANIAKATANITSGITANNKAYDGTTTATISSNNVVLGGVMNADTNNVRLSTNGYTATFASANVGTGKVVTVGGLNLTGSAATNYALTQPNLAANITVPAIASITAPANGTYRAGQNLDFTVVYDGNVTVNTGGGTPAIGLSMGLASPGASYLSGSGSKTLVFRYTVQTGDTDANGISSASPIALNGGAITDGAGDNAGLTFTVPNSSGVLVDANAPTTASVTSVADGAAFAAGSAPTRLSGSAADDSSGLGLNASSTTFTLMRNSDSSYWNGSVWQPGIVNLATTHAATTGGMTTTWTNSAALPSWPSQSADTYIVQVTAKDKAGNTFTGPTTSFQLLQSLLTTSLGIASDKTGANTLSLSAVTVSTGNTILVTVVADPINDIVTVTDSAGNSYSKDADKINSGGTRTLIFSGPVANALAGGVVTVNFAGTAPNTKAASIFSVTGLASPSPKDQSQTGAGNSTTNLAVNSGTTATTSQTDELLFGAFGINQTGTTVTQTGGFTNLTMVSVGSGSTSQLTLQPAYQVVHAAGAYADTATVNKAGQWAFAVVSYKISQPRILSITQAGPSPTAAASVSFVATFSEAVYGVSVSDFALVTNNITGAVITGVSTPDNTNYTVTVATGNGNGSLGLNLADNNHSIVDSGNIPVGGTGGAGTFTGPVYTIDRSATTTLATSATPVTYGKPVTLTATVSANALDNVTPSGTVTFYDGATTMGAILLSGSGTSATAAYTTTSTQLAAGTHSITAIYSGDSNYPASTNSPSMSQSVNKATPALTAPIASAITYGQSLGASTLSGGAATNVNNSVAVAGSFAFTTPAVVPNAGTANVSVTFAPADTANYNNANTTVAVTVGQQTPVVATLPTASPISYGQTLARSTLSGGTVTNAAGALVTGSFAFATPAIAPEPGTTNVIVTFTPADAANYSSVTTAVTVTVAKQTPVVATVPTATAIIYGQTLANSTLSGGTVTNAAGAPVAGSFAFTTTMIAPDAGITNVSVTFAPTDTVHYNPVTTTVAVSVGTEAISVATAPVATPITYGQTLSASTLSGGTVTNAAGAPVAGSFAFANAALVPDAGSTNVNVVFTPADPINYASATTTISVMVAKQTPVVATAPAPTAITYGQTLADSTLSGGTVTNAAGSSVAGSFAFTTPAIAPEPGTTNVSVTFTPADAANYASATATVMVAVGKQTPMVATAPVASAISYGQTLADSTLSGGTVTNAAGAAVAGSFAFTMPTNAPNAGMTNVGVTFTPADTDHYNPVLTTVAVSVGTETPLVATAPVATPITYGQTLSASTLSGGTMTNAAGAPVPGSFAFANPTVAPDAGSANASVVFTPADATNYASATTTISVLVAKQTPVVATAPAPTAITYGQTLADSTLSDGTVTNAAGEAVSGSFAFAMPDIAPNAGSTNVSVIFTPDDTTNYESVATLVTVAVDQQATVVATLPVASTIVYGQTLADSTLSGGTVTNAAGATVDGTFAFSKPAIAPDSGTTNVDVTFTPADSVNYASATATVVVTVNDQATNTTNVVTQRSATGQKATLTMAAGKAQLTFYGIPNDKYGVQRSTDLVNWTLLMTTNAPANGVIQYEDDFSDLGQQPSSAFYRLISNP
jgi:prolyl-tRNA editing enzyme YbaK/EbsC (Cys-tRNA(Pro) deacylase)